MKLVHFRARSDETRAALSDPLEQIQAKDWFGSRTWPTGVKGNIASLWHKRPFKLDLNKFERGQNLSGLHKLTFNNLVFDNSCRSEALAYELFRDAGVPAPRTAYVGYL